MPRNPLVVVREVPAADPVDTIMPALGQLNAGPAAATHRPAVVHPVALLVVTGVDCIGARHALLIVRADCIAGSADTSNCGKAA